MNGESRLYVDSLGMRNKLFRALWQIVWLFLFRFPPNPGFHSWRIFLLRAFGARIGSGCKIARSCNIWAPWNLEMGNFVCLAANVDCYNVGKIRLDSYSTVSQRSFLCTASHDVNQLSRPLTVRPITLGEHAWVCAEAFIGPGVQIGQGAVIGARTVVTKDVEPWMIMTGNPARALRKRKLIDFPEASR